MILWAIMFLNMKARLFTMLALKKEGGKLTLKPPDALRDMGMSDNDIHKATNLSLDEIRIL